MRQINGDLPTEDFHLISSRPCRAYQAHQPSPTAWAGPPNRCAVFRPVMRALYEMSKMSKIKRMIFAPYVSFTWVKAVELAAYENYEKSYKLLGRLQSFMETDPEYQLLKALVMYRMNNSSSALISLNRFYEVIEGHNSYSNVERNYLCCYADKLLNSLSLSNEDVVSRKFRGKFEELNLDLVNSQIKINFPLEMR